MIRLLLLSMFGMALASCTQFQSTPRDPKSGYFPSDKKVSVIVSKEIDLDQRKALVLVLDSDFFVAQAKNIGYFDEVATSVDLEKQVIANNLADKIASINDRIGIHNTAKYYKPFLWLRHRLIGVTTYGRQAQVILTDPLTMEDLFVAETSATIYSLTDQNVWYPMHNALIDYIRQNSKAFRK